MERYQKKRREEVCKNLMARKEYFLRMREDFCWLMRNITSSSGLKGQKKMRWLKVIDLHKYCIGVHKKGMCSCSHCSHCYQTA